jgi:hypothetical protein
MLQHNLLLLVVPAPCTLHTLDGVRTINPPLLLRLLLMFRLLLLLLLRSLARSLNKLLILCLVLQHTKQARCSITGNQSCNKSCTVVLRY